MLDIRLNFICATNVYGISYIWREIQPDFTAACTDKWECGEGNLASATRRRNPGKPAQVSGSSQGLEGEQEKLARGTREGKVPCEGTEVRKTLLLLTLCVLKVGETARMSGDGAGEEDTGALSGALQDQGEVRPICRNKSELQASICRNELSEMFQTYTFNQRNIVFLTDPFIN